MAYSCSTHRTDANGAGHLYKPCHGTRKTCSYCGTPEEDSKYVCGDKQTEMKFVCSGCGRDLPLGQGKPVRQN